MAQGQLTVIVGPMFAAKSRHLLEMAHDAMAQGKIVYGVKPAIDTRQTDIRSRNGIRLSAAVVHRNGLFEVPYPAQVLAIDEVHMFDLPLVTSVETARAEGIDVIAAGVDFNTRTKPFMTMMELLSRADQVMRCFSFCQCGQVAWYTRRLVDTDVEIVVGSDIYEPVCSRCMNDQPEDHLVVRLPRIEDLKGSR